ncbi:MAG: SH3 domain-containing protein [Allorhizobium sp.]
MNFLKVGAAALALLVLPAVAEAATAYSTANVNMRSGPSTRYPAVVVIPAAARVEILGCMRDANWCDVTFAQYRGWVSGSYLQTTYSKRRVYVDPQYYRPLGIPSVEFNVDTYWDRNYRSRDFYRDRDRWSRDNIRPRRDDYRPPRRDDNRPPRYEDNRPRFDDNRPPRFDDNRPQRRDDNRRPQREENRPPQQEDNRPPREENRPQQQDNRPQREAPPQVDRNGQSGTNIPSVLCLPGGPVACPGSDN